MIIREFYKTREDGVNLYRTYSDSNVKIKSNQDDAIYDEAIDVENTQHTYSETDIPVGPEDLELTDSQALSIIMGRGLNELPDSNVLSE